ncbi:AraC family transcriptional regulator [Paenibacillus psychroresistens]|uniref:AraC family transcriptional regulator n=1 Tax=Paenibacillus psychroresistens TaxID=1778678 RepID=A0A6B8RRN0_9BACL|nr:AraC family transcriptional regulator [Paenibacillus psychroresistens]QGQ99050.1 AraC family transcriptional regulator [Paenibacillus psychroresistens]
MFTSKLSQDIEIYLSHYLATISGEQVSFSVHYWGLYPKHLDNPVHKHSCYEVCYVISGEGSYIEEEIEYPLSTGTLFLSRPHLWHQIRSEQGLALAFVAFEVMAASTVTKAVKAFHQLTTTTNFIIRNAENLPSVLLWRALLEQTSRMRLISDDYLKNMAHCLLVSFLEAFVENNVQEINLDMHSIIQVNQIKLMIRDNLERLPLISDLAKHVYISERHLSRLFLEHTGQNITEYIRAERMKLAIGLLKATKESMKGIAEKCGFTTVQYFTKVFSAVTGVSPARYRDNFVENEAKMKNKEK